MAVRIVVHHSVVSNIVDLPVVAAMIGEMLAAGADAARSHAPSRTGALRASIRVDHYGHRGTFGSGIYYARHVEFGTSDTPTQPYLRPAIDAMRGAAPGGMI